MENLKRKKLEVRRLTENSEATAFCIAFGLGNKKILSRLQSTNTHFLCSSPFLLLYSLFLKFFYSVSCFVSKPSTFL